MALSSTGKEEEAAEALRIICPSICAIFLTEYALAKLWMSWGVQPTAMTGHSLGEYTAACLAGVMSLGDALRIVALRGKLVEKVQGAAMLSVPLAEDELRGLLTDDLDLAAVNGPSMCLVSAGLGPPLDGLQDQLAVREIDCRRLHGGCESLSPVGSDLARVPRGNRCNHIASAANALCLQCHRHLGASARCDRP